MDLSRFEGNPWVAKAFATIPSVNMWDDHVSSSSTIEGEKRLMFDLGYH